MPMTSVKKKLTAVIALAAAVIALYAAVTYMKNESFNKELASQFNTAAVVGEAHAARVRLELKALESAAEKYRDLKDEMAHMAENRIKAYNDALLVLVNPWNNIDADYVPKLSTVEDGFQVDRRCADALKKMLFDCRQEGYFPVICSAYRTQEYQQELYDKKVKRVLAEGVSVERAPEIAAKSVAVPGTSEHQLGLAVDLIDYFYTNLDQGQERTATQKWLMEHCTDYGFILRYPNGTTDITGIIYEPWHYRYVGKPAAREITELGITFEEYVEMKSYDIAGYSQSPYPAKILFLHKKSGYTFRFTGICGTIQNT